jgi:hypothetical protein
LATRCRPRGQCSKCGKTYPETDEFFHRHKRRGRIELRAICKQCQAQASRKYGVENAEAIRRYNQDRGKTDHRRGIMLAASRRFHAKPEYKKIDRELYRRVVLTPARAAKRLEPRSEGAALG